MKKVKISLDLNFDSRCTGGYAVLVFQLNCIPLKKQNIKMSFLFEDKHFFLFLCLRTSKILSLGEFDEHKSHLFLVHFSV